MEKKELKKLWAWLSIGAILGGFLSFLLFNNMYENMCIGYEGFVLGVVSAFLLGALVFYLWALKKVS